jgi:hypothetical protein
MFVIRNTVWDKFAEDAYADFVARMRVHLGKFFPEQCEALGPEKTGELIEFGIERARFHGFENEREVCKYIDLMCIFGRNFDQDEKQPWARHILESRFPPDPEERMRHLHATALDALRDIDEAERYGARR